MTKYRYTLSKSAESDLIKIKEYLEEEASISTARNVLNELRLKIRFLSQNPFAGHFREDLTDFPLRFWSVYSNLIIYDPNTKPINIVRILHSSQDIPEIL